MVLDRKKPNRAKVRVTILRERKKKGEDIREIKRVGEKGREGERERDGESEKVREKNRQRLHSTFILFTSF